MTALPDTISALLSLAPDDEREDYALVLAALGGSRTHDDARARWYLKLLPILMDKLRNGEVTAHAFGSDPSKPIKIDPKAWHRLQVNVGANSTFDGENWLNEGINAPGTEFYGLHFVMKSDARGTSHAARARKIAMLKAAIEKLDWELPLSATKREFRAELGKKFDFEIRPEWFRSAWTAAQLRPERSAPGVRRI